jgi:hypothetical protein
MNSVSYMSAGCQAALTAWVAMSIFIPNPIVAADEDVQDRMAKLGVPNLSGPVATFYSKGAKQRAEKLQKEIRRMKTFYRDRLHIDLEVSMAALNPEDWKVFNGVPYGLPNCYGNPPVIFMPSQSGGLAFNLVMARKDAIPPDNLSAYLKSSGKMFEAVADDYVDFIGFHELGHELQRAYGIDYGSHWLNEFVVAERLPETKRLCDLCGRPSKQRPKNTTLDDFERLYMMVDDYGWYQGMFERRIQEVYPKMGIEFLVDVKRLFPLRTPAKDAHSEQTENAEMSPDKVLNKLESIAPGFLAWARDFEP